MLESPPASPERLARRVREEVQFRMRILPVIDLMQGVVVRGVAGKRDQYRPIVSKLCAEPTPAAVGGALSSLGFRVSYVADLDAIAGAQPNWANYRILMACGLELLVDAGAATSERVAALANSAHTNQPLGSIIVGLESILSEADLTAAVKIVTPARLIFSLDLRGGRPITNITRWKNLSSEAIADEAVGLGVRRLIVLDLEQVGVHSGVSTGELCRSLRCRYPSLEIISGGGVRHVDDLAQLAASGCDAALVASALHDGKLSASDLRSFT
jgi:phosphoribosylformimino-5-aminoimidazole carboxamide ribotide isomerase